MLIPKPTARFFIASEYKWLGHGVWTEKLSEAKQFPSAEKAREKMSNITILKTKLFVASTTYGLYADTKAAREERRGT